jgi:hypothetical protein
VRVAFRDLLNATDDKITLRGKLTHPPIDPSVGGATFTVTDQNGSIYSVTIPAGAWEIRKPGSKWVYKDDTGAIGGVRRASISEAAQGTAFKVRLKAMDVSLSGADLPSANVVVSVSNATSGTSISMRNAPCRLKTKGVTCRL